MLTYEFIDPETQLSSEDFLFTESFLKATGRTQIGWHYIIDLTWIYSRVKHWSRSLKILDAGGGSGPVQFLLAEMGFNITNIDMVLSAPPLAYSRRYQTKLEVLPSYAPTSYKELINSSSKSSFIVSNLKKLLQQNPVYQVLKAKKYQTSHNKWRTAVGLSEQPIGTIEWYVGNLCHLPEFASGSFDAIVSLSSLEHIPTEYLCLALNEIHRIIKPNAHWAVTTSGTEKSSTWLHEPSKGYCFSATDIKSYFGATTSVEQDANIMLTKYQTCDYLKNNLADFYKTSGKFGMPWGIWEPKYIPVGLAQ